MYQIQEALSFNPLWWFNAIVSRNS
uniref:Uncharacterized protein n=1 Tax=Arundo donax TaxID=35708 RepID=A0A0A9CHH2_ARUDO